MYVGLKRVQRANGLERRRLACDVTIFAASKIDNLRRQRFCSRFALMQARCLRSSHLR